MSVFDTKKISKLQSIKVFLFPYFLKQGGENHDIPSYIALPEII